MLRGLLFLFFFCVSWSAVADQRELETSLFNLNEEFDYRQKLEQSTPFIAESLCYRYKYQQAKGIELTTIRNTYEDLLSTKDWYFDSQLQDSIIVRYILGGSSLKGAFWLDSEKLGGGIDILFSQSKFIFNLKKSVAFKNGLLNCAKEMAIDPDRLSDLIFKEIDDIVRAGNIAGYLAPATVTVKLTSLAAKALSRINFIKRNAKWIGTLFYGGLTSVAVLGSIGTYYSISNQQEVIGMMAQGDASVGETHEHSFLGNYPIIIRTYEFVLVVSKLKKAHSVAFGDSQRVLALIGEKTDLQITFNFFAEHRETLLEISKCYEDHLNSIGASNAKIEEILAKKKAKVELTAMEQEIFFSATTYVAINELLKLIDAQSG